MSRSTWVALLLSVSLPAAARAADAPAKASAPQKPRKPVFLDFSEDADLGGAAVVQGEQADRDIVGQVLQGRWVLKLDDCPKGAAAKRTRFVHVQTVRAPRAEGRLLHHLSIIGCEMAPEYAREDKALLAISEQGRVVAKQDLPGTEAIVKVFALEQDGPAGVVVVGGCTLCKGDTTTYGWVYEVDGTDVRLLRDLGLVFHSPCAGAFPDAGEQVAVLFLESASPLRLSQRNYRRTCEAAEAGKKSYTFVSGGKMKDG